MKLLFWFVGVLQILTGFMLAWTINPGWKWVWISIAIVWFFVGVIEGMVGIARMAAGKWGGARRGPTVGGRAHEPHQQKEE